jgi:hypothetical protein
VRAGVGVVPQEFYTVERARYVGKEFDPREVPAEFNDIPFGRFEVLVGGAWYGCRGSWVSDGGPMVWREEEAL